MQSRFLGWLRAGSRSPARTIASEAVGSGHLVNSLVHGLDDSGTKGLSDIAYSEADDIGLGMHHTKGIHLLGDVGEQVVVLEVQEMDIY